MGNHTNYRTGIPRVRAIEKEIQKLENELVSAREKLHKALKSRKVRCESNCYGTGCGAYLTVGKLTYLQTWNYIQSYDYDGSDWHPGEGQFDCPKCGHRNRLLKDRARKSDREDFKCVIDIDV